MKKEKEINFYNVLNNRAAKMALTASLLLTGVSTAIPTAGPSNGIVGDFLKINHAEASGIFAGGTGTVADPYLVSNAMQLYQMSNYLTSHFKLTNNIDLTGIEWSPIGSATGPEMVFKGSFDGNNFTINGLSINSSSSYVGLFGYTNGASIKNIAFTNANVKGASYVGVVVGNMVNGSLKDVSVEKGKVVGTSSYTGGLVGMSSATGENLSADMSVKGTSNTGGLFGKVTGSLKNAYSKGSVEGVTDVGGIAGIATGQTTENIFSAADVKGKERIAGLFGATTGVVKKGYALGSIEGDGSGVVAALIASHSGTVSELMALNSNVSGSKANSASIVYGANKATKIYLPDKLDLSGYQKGATDIVTAESILDGTAFSFLTTDDNWVIEANSKIPSLAFQSEQLSTPSFLAKTRYQLQDGVILSNIYDSTDLNNIRNDVSGYYSIKEDIDLSALEWVSVDSFSGKINGNGKSIINLFNTDDGMFGELRGEVENLVFVNPKVISKSYKSSVGILAGYMTGKVSNVSFLDSYISVDSTYIYDVAVGTLAGEARGFANGKLSIDKVFVRGEVHTNKASYVGGVIGTVGETNDSVGIPIINQIVFDGKVNALNNSYNSYSSVGGLIGYLNDGHISNVYSSGSVKGDANVGGIIGRSHNLNKGGSSLKLAYSTSSVSGTSGVGGLIGNNASSIVNNALALNENVTGTTGTNTVGIAFGTNSTTANGISALDTFASLDAKKYVNQFISNEQAKSKSPYYFKGFEFGDSGNLPIWGIVEGEGTPYLLFSPSGVKPEIDEAVKLAIGYVVKAESTKNKIDIEAALDLVNKLQDGEIKTQLTERLNAIQQSSGEDKALEDAKNAVDELSDNPTQEELDKAKDKVDELSDGPAKDILLDEIKEKQETLNRESAAKAVEKAENSKTQTDVYLARDIVNKLSDGEVKTNLKKRLDVLQQAIDTAKHLADVRLIVNKLGDNPTQINIDQARSAVESLLDSVDKTELSKIVESKQEALDVKVADARKAVEVISTPPSLEELAKAQEKVNMLPAGDIKNDLLKEINEKRKQLDVEANQLAKAETAVLTAENYPTNYNVTIATKLVEALPEGPNKKILQNRLQAIQDMFALEKAETKVKQAENFGRDPYLSDAINLVETLKDSEEKQALKDRLQVITDKLQAEKDAEEAKKDANGAYNPADPKQTIEDAINTIQDAEAKKYFTNWNKSVSNAENYFSKTTVKNAMKYLTDMPSAYTSVASYENIIKELRERTENLKAEEVAVDIFAPVEKAVANYEKYKTSYYLKKAKESVETLSDSQEKTAFEIRLGVNAPGDGPTEEEKLVIQLANVEKAVANYEKFKTNFYQKKALEAIELLVESEERTAFESRINVVVK